MYFNNSFYENEVREGFFIPSMTKRSWAVQMDILDKVTSICKENNIKWFADYGTLIGAVRHQGFIPWDDDLDICMLQDDYIKFNSIVKEYLPSEYLVLNIENEPSYENFLTRIVNSKGINYSAEFLSKNHGFPYTAGIDIFPLNYVYADEEKEKNRCRIAKKIWNILEERKKYSDKELKEYIEKISNKKLADNLNVLQGSYKLLNELFFECKTDESGKVVQNPFYICYNNHIYLSEYFSKAIELPFEGGVINVPLAYEKKLQTDYGNWFVASQAGGKHDYPFYLEQENILKKHNNNQLYYKYLYNNPKIDKEKRNQHKEKSDLNIQRINIIEKANNIFNRFIAQKDNQQILELAGQCQNIAIAIGTDVEKYENSNSLVSILEEYCESLFNLCNEGADNLLVDSLIKLVNIIKEKYLKLKEDNSLIIFMPYSYSNWKYMEKEYYIKKSKYGSRVKIMPIPFYEKQSDGRLINEQYSIDNYSDDNIILDYRKFDFNNNHMKEIIIQNPYDEYDSAISVHPFFYAKEIRNYTDKLIYIPPYNIDEIKDNHEKAIVNLSNYAVTPAVIFSDEIILKSENEKERYLLSIEELCGENEKNNISKKIIVREDIANLIEEKGNEEYLLFYLSSSNFFNDSIFLIKKLKEVIKIFKDNKDKLKYIWILENRLLEKIDNNDKVLLEEIIDDYKNNNLGEIYDNLSIEDIDNCVNKSKAFYGSPGYIMNVFLRKAKPVMVMDINVIN